VHGHRGCRGLLPENSLPAFRRAIDLGCDYLELDVVMSGDGQLIVSHEPWMSERLCLTPNEEPITAGQAPQLNLFHMTAAEIRRYDCGSVPQARFPHQETLSTYKPTLAEVVEMGDEHALMNGHVSPSYNIEVKSRPEWVGTYQPDVAAYVAAVIATIDSLDITERCIVQSFDTAILQAMHAERPDITLALLVENTDGIVKNLARLGFKPAIYSPSFELADEATLRSLRTQDIELVVWTVNEKTDIDRMVALGVDGIISDYPDRVQNALQAD
jgi:glycerophosphoryl diester phosphodiesterase